ncbi:prolipoprotein diacylglyceryl transferase [bacterium]|nr:prolipoprotein diacylglyceryl transferase [bacterium]
MHPILLKIGPLTLYTYGLCIAIAYLVGVALAERRASSEGIEKRFIIDLALVTFLFGLVGSRLFCIFFDLKHYLSYPSDILGRAGFVWQGALVFGIISGIFYVKKRGYPVLQITDIVFPSIALGESIGRWGCFFNGCCYGKPTDSIFEVVFPHLPMAVHPTQLYLSGANFILFLFLIRIKPRFTGAIFFAYLIGYSSIRFFIDFLRGDSAEVLFFLKVTQFISLATIIVAIFFIKRCRRANF